ncbi:hypothetical protein K1X76_12775 [bacterium]|nr:hypothetical protein [bacterium]
MGHVLKKSNLEMLSFEEDEQTIIDTSPQAILSPMYQFFHSPYFPKTFFFLIAQYFKGVRTRMIESRDNDRIMYADSLYQRVRRFIESCFTYMANNLKS